MAVIIEIEGLGKRYHIGAQAHRSDTLMDAITHALQAPMRRFRQLSGGESSNPDVLWAVRNVSLDISEGDVVGIVGRNGAGKSTLLKLLCRITDPTEGRIRMRGRVGSLLEVGTGFHPDLTGRENVFLNGAILGMTRSEIGRKFDEIVAFAEMERFLETPVKHYSSGMYVRLAFAVAAHLQPEILIVDEVLAVGDVRFQKKCLGKMEDVRHSGMAVLFVSHNMSAVRSLCNRGVLLENGECCIVGRADEAVDEYLRLNATGATRVPLKARKRARPGLPTLMAIVGVTIENRKRGIYNEGVTLDEVRVRIAYEMLADVERFSAEVRFRDLAGNNLMFSSAGRMCGVTFHPRKGEQCGEVFCTIPHIPFAIGEYSLEVGLTIPGVQWLDQVEDACRLSITMSDPVETGFEYRGEQAPMYVECVWTDVE